MNKVAADLNNLGVAYVEIGDFRQSLDLFRDALTCTMGQLEPIAAPAVSQQAHPHGMVIHGMTLPGLLASQELVIACTGRHVAADAQPSRTESLQLSYHPALQAPATAAPFVHAQGINVIPCENAYSPDDLVNTTVISGIILFNLALVYHLRGLNEGVQSSERLLKARSLYQKCHLLLADAGVPLHSTGNPVIDMLSMALFNNLAHASYELRAYEDSRSAFDLLIRFALTIVSSRYGDAYIGSIVDQQKSKFLLNAIILHAPKFAAAA